ncbi:MAG: hypothetical protein ACO1NO_03140 [Burkholderiaceae bacterium]
MKDYPTTPDGRYFVVNGRLWRCADPSLSDSRRSELVRQLMAARRAVRSALREQDDPALRQARTAVNEAKTALGERGAVWWTDGAPDYNRKSISRTPYASWYAELSATKT